MIYKAESWIQTTKLAKISMLDQDMDTKCPKSGNSDLPSEGIIRGPTGILDATGNILMIVVYFCL